MTGTDMKTMSALGQVSSTTSHISSKRYITPQFMSANVTLMRTNKTSNPVARLRAGDRPLTPVHARCATEHPCTNCADIPSGRLRGKPRFWSVVEGLGSFPRGTSGCGGQAWTIADALQLPCEWAARRDVQKGAACGCGKVSTEDCAKSRPVVSGDHWR